MRTLSLLLLLLTMNLPYMHASKPKPDPSQYTQVAHVIGSASGQRIVAVIGGVQYSMTWGGGGGLLKLGDYRARVTPSGRFSPKSRVAFEVWPAFELLMPDNSVRDYNVFAMGSWTEPASVAAATPAP